MPLFDPVAATKISQESFYDLNLVDAKKMNEISYANASLPSFTLNTIK